MNKEEIREAIENGSIVFSSLIEIIGKPKEHIQKTMENVLVKLKDDSRFTVLKQSMEPPVEVDQSDTLFSVFAEVELLTKDISQIYDFIFAYMPASVEILEPQSMKFSSADATGILNDIAGRLHQNDSEVKRFAQENRVLQSTLGTLVQNAILLAVAPASKTKAQIAKLTGIQEDQIDRFLTHLEKDGKLKKSGEAYSLVK